MLRNIHEPGGGPRAPHNFSKISVNFQRHRSKTQVPQEIGAIGLNRLFRHWSHVNLTWGPVGINLNMVLTLPGTLRNSQWGPCRFYIGDPQKFTQGPIEIHGGDPSDFSHQGPWKIDPPKSGRIFYTIFGQYPKTSVMVHA